MSGGHATCTKRSNVYARLTKRLHLQRTNLSRVLDNGPDSLLAGGLAPAWRFLGGLTRRT